MSKPKYISNPFPLLILIFLGLLGGVLTICWKEYVGAIICFSVALFWSCLLIILRKKLFIKMLIDDNGIKQYYGKHLIKELLWSDIKTAIAKPTAYGGQIIFSNENFTSQNELKINQSVFVSFNSKLAICLYRYVDKIPVTIQNLEKLNPVIIEKLKKKS